ncbi:hypothetical protein D3C85_1303530 [compost metagenome]
MREQPPQVVHSPVVPFLDQLVDVVVTRLSRDELLLIMPVQAATPVYPALGAGGAQPGLIGDRAGFRRVVYVADELSWTPWHIRLPSLFDEPVPELHTNVPVHIPHLARPTRMFLLPDQNVHIFS